MKSFSLIIAMILSGVNHLEAQQTSDIVELGKLPANQAEQLLNNSEGTQFKLAEDLVVVIGKKGASITSPQQEQSQYQMTQQPEESSTNSGTTQLRKSPSDGEKAHQETTSQQPTFARLFIWAIVILAAGGILWIFFKRQKSSLQKMAGDVLKRKL